MKDTLRRLKISKLKIKIVSVWKEEKEVLSGKGVGEGEGHIIRAYSRRGRKICKN